MSQREHKTRSRANPGGMDVLKVLGPEVRPIRERKIASIGVHASKGVTAHGFAVNVDNDLQPFEWVVPCGLHAQMTSITRELQTAPHLPCFRKRMGHAFTREHGRRQRLVALQRLLSREPSVA